MSSNNKYPVIKTTSNTNSLLNAVSNNNTSSFINPVRTDASYNSVLSYNSTTKEITTGGYITNPIKSSSNENFFIGNFQAGSGYNSTAITQRVIYNGICNGTGDGASYTSFNLGICSWQGTGFINSEGLNCKAFINHRNGDFNTKGNIIYDINNFPANVPIFVGNFNSDGTATHYNAVSNLKGNTGSTNVVNLARTSGAYDLLFTNFTLGQTAVSISTQTANITYTWQNLGNGIRCTFRNLALATVDAYFCITIYKIS